MIRGSLGFGTLSGGSASYTTVKLALGLHSITATYPGDTNYLTATSAVYSLTVNQGTPAIAWATPAAISYGTALSATQLDATTPVAGTFASTPPSGALLTPGPQTLSVTFTPTDTVDYKTATASVTLTVNKATPTITWTAPAAIAYGTELSATQLDASSTVAGTFAYSPVSGTVLTAGPQSLSGTLTPTDSVDYTTAAATVSLAVNKATPTISWSPTAITFGAAL